MKKIARNLAELEILADDWLRNLIVDLPIQPLGATFVALHGDLGAGKTTFVRAVAKNLSLAETVNSPTFVIMKTYDLPPDRRWKKLIHFDAYRLESAAELEKLGWRKILADPANLIFLEWPERVAGALPVAARHLTFRFIDETTRELDI